MAKVGDHERGHGRIEVAFPAHDADIGKLGHVQFFKANRVLGHHAWVRLENGQVMRGYAWAGKTLWNQGMTTRAETEFGLKCFQYFESPDQTFEESEIAAELQLLLALGLEVGVPAGA